MTGDPTNKSHGSPRTIMSYLQLTVLLKNLSNLTSISHFARAISRATQVNVIHRCRQMTMKSSSMADVSQLSSSRQPLLEIDGPRVAQGVSVTSQLREHITVLAGEILKMGTRERWTLAGLRVATEATTLWHTNTQLQERPVGVSCEQLGLPFTHTQTHLL